MAIFQLTSLLVPGRDAPRLDCAELSIDVGITAVVGPSGAGKTTLLDVLVGFVQPTSGSIAMPASSGAVGGLPLYWCPDHGGLWPHLTVREHLAAVLPTAGPGRDAVVRKAVDRWLERFDLAGVAGIRPGQLSRGQQGRLGVARALASGARVLVLDEPLAHVDPARVGGFWRVLVDHARETETSVVFATHEPPRVLAHADRVVCLDHGRVAWHGPVHELYVEPPNERLAGFLGYATWLPEEEAAAWTGDGVCLPHCLRPEHVSVEPAEDGPLLVTDSTGHGPVTETVLQSEDGARTRRFYHATGNAALQVGGRAILRLHLCLAFSLLVLCGGCSSGGTDTLAMEAVAHRQLPPLGTKLPAPRGLVATGDHVIVLDSSGRVLVLDRQLHPVRTWMMPEYSVGRPEGVCQLRDGRIAVADTHYSRVVFFDGTGTVLATIGSRGTRPGEFLFPVKLTQDASGFLYVAEYGSNDRVQKFTAGGEFVLSFGSHGTEPGQFDRPSGIVCHEKKVYVADAVNHRIQVFDESGNFIRVLGDAFQPLELKMPYDLSIGPDGDLYACEWGAGRVSRITIEGRLVGHIGQNGRGAGQLRTPWGVTVARDGRVIVADTGNMRLVEWRH